MHIYTWQIWPPSELSIDALNTTTPNLADIAQCTYTHGRSTPQSIEYRCLEYHYTKLGRSGRYSTMHIYTWQIYTPSQLSIDALNTATPNLADIADIAQICMAYWFPSQWSIDALNTATPNLADVAQCTYPHARLTIPPAPIKHRTLENQYTKYVTDINSTMHIYAMADWPNLLQSDQA